jgi:ubiquinone/menaquinone biosynthesis C-methylase UbiE
MTNQAPTPTHQAVQEYYGKAAREAGGSCCESSAGSQSGSCCDPATGRQELQNDLYPLELLSGIPTEIVNGSAGSGDPISLAALKPGETVLDLGSGGGLDCFLAARQVGATGKVIGVDMTPDMLALARANAARLKVENVEFREGYLEALPVEAGSVEVVLSNCVINLSPDKPQVLREMFRVLKSGGRIALSDMVTNRAIKDDDRKDNEQWCACTSGALRVGEYFDELTKAGFTEIRIEPNVETILQAVESGRVRGPQALALTKEQLKEAMLADLQKWEHADRLMIAPHKITARKPL